MIDEYDKELFLAHSQLSGFKRKVDEAKKLISQYIDENSFVSVSWGKDSTVLYHLCQQIKPDVLGAFYGSPEMDIVSNWSEVRDAYNARFNSNYIEFIAKPEWANTPHGPGERLKLELDKKYDKAFVGIRSEESKNRTFSLMQKGLIYKYKSGIKNGSTRICPIGWWQTKDIWAYLFAHDLPYLKIYEMRDWETSRTNPHMRFWIRAFKGESYQKQELEYIKQTDKVLYEYLLLQVPEAFHD